MARARGRGLERVQASREETRRREHISVRRRRMAIRIVAGAAVVIGAGAVIALSPPAPGVAFQSLGNTHLSHPDQPHAPYNSSPPSSGPHLGVLAHWGESEEPLPPELFVHNLEDGGIVLAYACRGCPDLVDGLRQVLAGHDGRRVLLTPVEPIVDATGTPRRGAAVAWSRVFHFDDLDEHTRDELGVFIDLYEGLDHHVRTGGFGHG